MEMEFISRSRDTAAVDGDDAISPSSNDHGLHGLARVELERCHICGRSAGVVVDHHGALEVLARLHRVRSQAHEEGEPWGRFRRRWQRPAARTSTYMALPTCQADRDQHRRA